MEDITQSLRLKLAEEGHERTPGEVEEMVCLARRLRETVDQATYERFASMTPGKVAVESMKERCPPSEIIDVRDLIMYVYERCTLGIKDAPLEHPLADPRSNL